MLFGSWFSFPRHILALREMGLDVIARVKNTPKVLCRYCGQMLTVSEIYKRNRKRRGRSRYLLSVGIDLCGTRRKRSIPAKLVCVRSKKKPKEYIVLLSTDDALPEEEIIRIYGKRWDIEVFFKACKSCLCLGKECASRSCGVMTAYTAAVFARCTMLSLENRIQRDGRSFGALADIKFAEAFCF